MCGTPSYGSCRRCRLCDSALEEGESRESVSAETIDLRRPGVGRRSLLIGMILAACVAVPWLFMSIFFDCPRDVELSRKHYAALKASYLAHQDFWRGQKQSIVQALQATTECKSLSCAAAVYQDVPLEVAMAFLFEDLGLSSDRFPDMALFPLLDRPVPTLLLSKYEQGVWPFKIVLSLEIAFEIHEKKLAVSFQKLRRGKITSSPSLAYVYFGPELESLRKIRNVEGSLHRLEFYRLEESPASSIRCQGVHLTWAD